GGPWQDDAPWWTIARDFLLAPDPIAPAAPSGLAASAASASQIDLTWADQSYNETAYRVERRTGTSGSFTPIATLPANSSSYSDTTGLSSGTDYSYRVVAVNTANDSLPTNVAAARTLDVAPAAPTSPAASALSTAR